MQARTQATPRTLARRYFAGTGPLLVVLGLVGLAAFGAELWSERLVTLILPNDSAAGPALWPVAVRRLDDTRNLLTVYPYLPLRWLVSLSLIPLAVLPIAARLGGYGRVLAVGIGLVLGGALGNALVLTANGVVHNWLAFSLMGPTDFTSFSIGDLAQIIGMASWLAVLATALLANSWIWLRARSASAKPQA